MNSKRSFITVTLFLFYASASCGCASILSGPILLDEKPLHPADVIVVLGYGPPVDEQGLPKPELVRRVKRGVELYNQGLAQRMIMTGGNTYKDYFESRVMKDVAMDMGVPEDAVFLEIEAMSTIGNARGSVRIMKDQGWNSAIIVSSPYHLKRALHLFSANPGIEFQTAGCEVPEKPGYGLVFTIYEYYARIPYLFFDEQAQARADWSEQK